MLASLAPGTAHASGAAAHEPAGAPGGATMAAATALRLGVSYRGTASERGQRFWYRLNAAGGEQVLLSVWGKTGACPIDARVLDASGRTLSQLISLPQEILPLIASTPSHPVSNTYYVRVEPDPFSSCTGAEYVFRLTGPSQPNEPVEPSPCEGPGEHSASECSYNQEPAPPKAGTAPSPTFQLGSCSELRPALDRVLTKLGYERGLVAHRRGSAQTLRQLEGERRTLARRAQYACDES